MRSFSVCFGRVRVFGLLDIPPRLPHKLHRKLKIYALIIILLARFLTPPSAHAFDGASVPSAASTIQIVSRTAVGASIGVLITPSIPVIVAVGAVGYIAATAFHYLDKAGEEADERDIQVPDKVIDVIDEIEKNNGEPPQGHKGGRIFKNHDSKLPKGTIYREYDVNPMKGGLTRDKERVVIGEDGSAYYTWDHYNNFIRIK